MDTADMATRLNQHITDRCLQEYTAGRRESTKGLLSMLQWLKQPFGKRDGGHGPTAAGGQGGFGASERVRAQGIDGRRGRSGGRKAAWLGWS